MDNYGTATEAIDDIDSRIGNIRYRLCADQNPLDTKALEGIKDELDTLMADYAEIYDDIVDLHANTTWSDDDSNDDDGLSSIDADHVFEMMEQYPRQDDIAELQEIARAYVVSERPRKRPRRNTRA